MLRLLTCGLIPYRDWDPRFVSLSKHRRRYVTSLPIASHIRSLAFLALDFRKWLGGEEVINSYCRDLALQGGKRVAEIMGTRLMDESEGNVQTLNMVGFLLCARLCSL